MTRQELFEKIKDKFNALIAPAVAAPIVAAPVAAAAPVPTIYKLLDGTEISITQAGATPAVGDMVTIAGAPPAAGDYTLEDNSVITVDAMGMITAIGAAAPITAAVPSTPTLEQRLAALEAKLNPAAAPLAMSTEGTPVILTSEEVKKMYEKFATGTVDERISNLETMIKALMECNFGYQIRQGIENTAIQTYKDSIATMQTAMSAQEIKMTEQQNVIKEMFTLVELIVKEPTTTPKTLSGNQQAKFERISARDQRLERMAEAMKKNKTLA